MLSQDAKETAMKIVTGMLRTPAEAEAAVERIMKLGYRREDISIMMSEATLRRHFTIEEGTQAAAGAGLGGVLGGAVGAALAAVAALGTSLVFPGIGLVVAGPIAAALAGAGAGGATGGLIGALVGAGIPEQRARAYETGLAGGSILVGAEARSDADADQIERILEDSGAARIRTTDVNRSRLDSVV
jgi:hypothetical protein